MRFELWLSGMKTFQTLLAALLLLSALQAQTPWTNWGIYRDSAGNGGSPVHGQLVCPGDTLWLVVDTTGMSAAGITSYGWRRIASAPPPLVVHCVGSSDCPGSLPAYFPLNGIKNTPKIGIKPNLSGEAYAFLLVTYYSNGDSAISARAIQTKGLSGAISWSLPTAACAGSTINGQFNFTGNVDSFVISYGSTTIRNQHDFTVNIPSGTGTLTVTATVYYCGNSWNYSWPINYYSSAPASGPSPSVASSASCPSASRSFSVSLPSGYTSFVWKVDGNSVDPSSTNHPTSYSWTPPGPGTYTITYEATYPCGTVTGSTTYTVSTPPSPSWLYVIANPSSGYCPGVDVVISAYAGTGLHTLDIGNDGSVERIGASIYYSGPVGVIPLGGLPIRIRFDDGCGGTKDTLFYYNPSIGSGAGSAYISVSPPSPRCNQFVNASLMVMDFPQDSIRQVQWSWDGITWTSPSNSLSAQLQVPSTPGPWTLRCQFVANAPACRTAPSSPVTTTVFFNTTISTLSPITSFCSGSGGVVRLVLPAFVLEGIDSIRYVLPDGTVITLPPTDTLSLTLPAGITSYPIVYWGHTACGLTEPRVYAIQPTPSPSISGSVWPSSTCAGGSVQVGANWTPGQVIDSVIALLLWNGQRIQVPISSPGWAFTLVPAPAAPGMYQVAIIAYNCAGRDTVTATFQVLGSNNAVASFTAPTSACVGQPVTFQRGGTNAGIASAWWNFGDGNIRQDTSMSVTHTYTSAGNYSVTLFIQSMVCGSSQFEQNIRVYDAPPTLSGLNVTPSGLTITYSVASASAYDQIVWDFGDGNTASGVLGGTHTYASAGTYTVKVRAINACDTTELSTTVSVSTGLVSGGANAWVVYPNPTRQEVFLTHPTYQGDLRVEIYDLTGRLVQMETLSSYPARVRLSLRNGIYTLRLISREGVATSRLLIE